ncbi:MAG TPA: carboxypeptidase-like regulatory domain-containing protein, partial [Thermoanaerobaculia bacterium]
MVDPEKLVTLSDRKGRFTFELAGEETMQVEAEAAGYLRRADLKVSLSPRSPKKVEIVLERGAIVSGRVLTTDGLPAASAEISFPEGRNGLTTPAGTEGEGRYRIAGIEPGNQTMEVKHPSGQASSKLSIAPGENRRPDLILDGNGLREILGRVTGPDGEPIASA